MCLDILTVNIIFSEDLWMIPLTLLIIWRTYGVYLDSKHNYSKRKSNLSKQSDLKCPK